MVQRDRQKGKVSLPVSRSLRKCKAAHETRSLICPTGKSVTCVSSPVRKNISLNPTGKSILKLRPSRPREGRWPSSRTLGGMRWTQQRRKTSGANADGEVVWSRRLYAGVNSRQCFALRGDGDNKARSPGRARRNPLKPLRREGRKRSGEPVVTCSCAFYFLHARLRVG